LNNNNIFSLQVETDSGLEQSNYLLTTIIDQAPVVVYKNSQASSFFHLTWQKLHSFIIAIGRGVWFQGEIE
jgi:hypothetical protein